MNQDNTLNLCEFFSVCSQLVLRAGSIIRENLNPKNLVVKIKNGYEPYTMVDVKVQTLIVNGLKSIWPKMTIIGEEEEIYKGKLGFRFKSLKKDIVPQNLFENLDSTDINLDDAIVWIDPLDGTSEFVQGCFDSVTTLIGISIKGESKVGVIGKYFIKSEHKDYEWTPRCYFAHADNPHLYYFDYSRKNEIREISVPRSLENSGLSICTSKSNAALEEFQKFFKVMNPDKILRVGGAGNKVLHVAEGKSDCYFFPRSGMKKWDICAGEAVMKSLGGIVTDSTNETIIYNKEKATWTCSKGIIVSISSEKHSRVTCAL